jgi:hypothetical protein
VVDFIKEGKMKRLLIAAMMVMMVAGCETEAPKPKPENKISWEDCEKLVVGLECWPDDFKEFWDCKKKSDYGVVYACFAGSMELLEFSVIPTLEIHRAFQHGWETSYSYFYTYGPTHLPRCGWKCDPIRYDDHEKKYYWYCLPSYIHPGGTNEAK